MDFFDQMDGAPHNLLPYDGCVYYYGPVLSVSEANYYYDQLLNQINWQPDDAMIYGRKITTKRKIAWHGDAAYSYSYSTNTPKTAAPWTDVLLALKNITEQQTGETFNACLLNLYHDGSEGMAWHSDSEQALKKNGAIGSLSLGAERKFSFKHKVSKETVSKVLEHGALLVMKDITQSHWLHRLPPTKLITTPRINLTFRTIDRG